MKIVKVISVLILFLFKGYLCFSQVKCDCYNRLKSLSTYYAKHKEFTMAISSLKDAISFVDKKKYNGFDFQTLSDYYYSLPDYDSALVYMGLAVINGVDSTAIINRYPNAFKNRKWGGFKAPNMPVNRSLESEFREREAYDQVVRMHLDPHEWLPDSLSRFEWDIRALMYHQIDSLNYLFLLGVIHKYGYPDYNKVGFNSLFKIMVLHLASYPGKIANDIIFAIDSLIKSGDYIEKADLLVYIDRNMLNTTGKTLGGTYGRDRFENLKNLASADSIRFIYNLLRIKEDGEGESIPKEYRPSAYPDNYFCIRKYRIKND